MTRAAIRVLTVLSTLLLTGSPVIARQPATQPSATHLRVLDENGTPLANATITIATADDSKTLTCDSAGRARIAMTAPGTVAAMAPGHVPARKYWVPAYVDPAWCPPAKFEFHLPRGTRVGGIIQNEHGQPIAGAVVRLYFEQPRQPGPLKPDEITCSLWDFPVNTDAAGQWQTDMAPATWAKAFVKPSHPDYAGVSYLTPITDQDAMRKGTAVVTMSVGRSIAGIVLDPSGQPLAGATVHVDNTITDESPATTTDQSGAFRFPHAVTSSLQVLVWAPGMAPQLESLPVDNVTNFIVRLQKPRLLRGIVVDDDGAPIAGASVFLGGWDKLPATLRAWTHRTDNAGKFEFEVPPGVSAVLSGNSSDAGSMNETWFPKDADNIQLTYRKPATITGRVVDADSGEPIKSFRVFGATDDPNFSNNWGTAECRGANGAYSLTFNIAFHTHRVRIEADGHLPAISNVLIKREGRYTFDAALKPAPNITGTVFGIDGKPLANVRVVDVLAGTQAFYTEDLMQPGVPGRETLTDERGTFTIWPPGEQYDLLVVHPSGYADITDEEFAKSRSLHLTPWSRVEGSVKGANVGLSISDPLSRNTHVSVPFSRGTRSDANGHFMLDFVPSGACVIVRAVSTGTDSNAGWQARTITTEPGKTATMNFDVGNHSIVGVIETPADLPADARFRVSRLRRIDGANVDLSRSAWSPQDLWTGGSTLNYQFNIPQNRSFTIPNVEPGKFELIIESSITSPGGYCGEGELVASYSKEIVIETNSSETIDLGTLKLAPAERIAVGELAPNFSVPTLGGGSVHLSDLRGKFVLLDFWATWCGPCKAELPNLRETFAGHKNDGRFVMMSLSADDKRDPVERYVSVSNMTWTQAWLGPWNDSQTLRDYHIRGVPSIWLIGPDGKVIAKNLRGEGIHKTVEAALKSGQ